MLKRSRMKIWPPVGDGLLCPEYHYIFLLAVPRQGPAMTRESVFFCLVHYAILETVLHGRIFTNASNNALVPTQQQQLQSPICATEYRCYDGKRFSSSSRLSKPATE